MEPDYLALACAYLKVDPARVLSHRVYPDLIVLVVDNGIAGAPKYTVPLSTLAQPKPEPKAAVRKPAARKGKG